MRDWDKGHEIQAVHTSPDNIFQQQVENKILNLWRFLLHTKRPLSFQGSRYRQEKHGESPTTWHFLFMTRKPMALCTALCQFIPFQT